MGRARDASMTPPVPAIVTGGPEACTTTSSSGAEDCTTSASRGRPACRSRRTSVLRHNPRPTTDASHRRRPPGAGIRCASSRSTSTSPACSPGRRLARVRPRRSRPSPSRCGPSRWRISAGTAPTASTCATRRTARCCGRRRRQPSGRRRRRPAKCSCIKGRRRRCSTARRAAAAPSGRRKSGPAPGTPNSSPLETTMRAEGRQSGPPRCRRPT